MLSSGYTRSKHDSCVYLKKDGKNTLSYLLLYVDDMLIASKSYFEIQKLKEQLKSVFEIKELGCARRILGMDIIRDQAQGKLCLLQADYATKVLRKFKMHEAKSLVVPLSQQIKISAAQCLQTEAEKKEMYPVPYSNTVGSIMYMMICTRPDLAYAINVLSRYMSNPGRAHWEALKGVLRYMKGTSQCGLMFEKIDGYEGNPLRGYVDADYAANVDCRRSQTGYIFTLFDIAVSWKSMLQSVVALSTTEAEFMAMTEAVKEGVWLKGMISEFGIFQKNVEVLCDNQSALHLVKHHVLHERSKHIDVRYHFIRDMVNKGLIVVSKVPTEENVADALTKALPRVKFRHCLDLVKLK